MNNSIKLVSVELLFSFSILTVLFISLTFLVIFFKSKLTIFIPDYNSVQKIHNSLVPPFGGIIIAVCIILTYFFINHQLQFLIGTYYFLQFLF